MNMDFNLIQQQSMKLVMTNELRQAITMLQYSVHDLQEYLQEQQLENPLIELKEPDVTKSVEFKEMHRSGISQEEDVTPLDFLSNKEEGLQDYLLSQLRVLSLSKETYAAVSYLALSTDENGYLEADTRELAEELGEPEEKVSDALALLQQLEPAGVGARSLKECLLLQLERTPVRDRLAERIIENHLQLLADKQFKQIARQEEVDTADVQQAADFIQTLNPKPGAVFYQAPAEYVTPEVFVEKTSKGWSVRLNSSGLPRMFMNRQYQQLLQKKNEEVQQYLKQKQEQFQWIRRSIEQRQETILKVTQAIVEHQHEFLEYGPEFAKPLTLKMIADKLEIHESTVSRATTRKYVQTPRGLYELKYFFQSGIRKETGEGQSAERAKIYLKRLLDAEDKKKPLSDQKLSELLKNEHHIELSRRTVAKYREEMHIASSSRRKRFE
ncbi:RNA polymerase factor sigma-54 [Alkalicoccus halolimnae]|uniref:RNA polymerase factor sigma-54 n=1 Tax=Alkalicoccus halolimnae TaxID=1667239 RepID=A0A5C7F5Z3_9BACI|nr:RNA polymerase factor sigma-54 [Alkalicoccus halolimnae]TXF84312.1 RNA polymerase factor sigma-54 [Alkalicoccus halolimnae]